MRLQALLIFSACFIGAQSAGYDRPSYLCLNKAFPGGWLATDPSTITQASVTQFLSSFNGTLGGTTRKLCISFNMWVLFGGANASTYLASLDRMLALVEANDLPFSISLDPTQWWQSRPDLYNFWDPSSPGYSPSNVYNVEWTGPSPDNATKISWRDWGSQFRVGTPHPNYASPAFRGAAAEALVPLSQRLAQWYQGLPSSKKYLLAYVRASQELSIGSNFYYYPNGNGLIPAPPSQDPVGGPGAGLQLGYAAVCGTSGACTQGQPLAPSQLDAVVSSFLSFSAGVLRDAGIPRSRLMVHIGADFQRAPACTPHTPAFPYPCAVFISPTAGLIPEAFPAWSLYTSGTDAASDEGLATALLALGGAPWGTGEWNIFAGPYSAWRSALNATLSFFNNRLLVVQNYESISGMPQALAAVVDALGEEVGCLVDAPSGLIGSAPDSQGRVLLTWEQGGDATAVHRFQVRLSSAPWVLPTGELAEGDVAEVWVDSTSTSALVTLPPGLQGDHVFAGVTALGCGPSASEPGYPCGSDFATPGCQRMAGDVVPVPLH